VFRAIKKLGNELIKTITTLFNPAPNSVYKARQIATVLVGLGMAGISAERCSSPSPDRVLGRLHEVDEEKLNRVVWKLNAKLLERLNLPKKAMLSLDLTILPYYGEEQPGLVSASGLPGTELGICFATLSIVEFGRTFTLAVRQVGPFTPRVKVLKEMLDSIDGLVEPRLILLDRAFFTVAVINELKSRGLHFIMPAVQNARIEKLCKAFERAEIDPVVDYTLGRGKNEAVLKLALLQRMTKKGLQTFTFASDMSLSPQRVSELYSCRWRIETNIRELEKFRAFTTSADMKLRRMYYQLAALLYNSWIVARNLLNGLLRAYEFKRVLGCQLRSARPASGPGPPI
jgi:putative transposase